MTPGEHVFRVQKLLQVLQMNLIHTYIRDRILQEYSAEGSEAVQQLC
jgi:hypothetical protein